MIDYLDLADFLLQAEAALGIDAEDLYMQVDLPLAESALSAPRAAFGGVEFYETFPEKVAVLGKHIVTSHPLRDGNEPTALRCMMEFTDRNGFRWVAPATDDAGGDETVEVLVALAAGELSGERFLAWVMDRIKADGIE